MKCKEWLILFLTAFMVMASSAYTRDSADDLIERAREVFEPIPASPPELKENPLTPEKIELGKMLFFDPRLSASRCLRQRRQ